LSFGGADSTGVELERLGAVLIAYQDGRVDVCLDVEKVEARWNIKQVSTDHISGLWTLFTLSYLQQAVDQGLPMLAVYETIDLGTVSLLKESTSNASGSLLDLLQASYPMFHLDPIHNDIIYVYHAFGVHSLDLSGLVEPLADALQRAGEDNDNDASLVKTIEMSGSTAVNIVVSTFSVHQK
jgi:nucleoporin NUP82